MSHGVSWLYTDVSRKPQSSNFMGLADQDECRTEGGSVNLYGVLRAVIFSVGDKRIIQVAGTSRWYVGLEGEEIRKEAQEGGWNV
jgi:hypothetical protein